MEWLNKQNRLTKIVAAIVSGVTFLSVLVTVNDGWAALRQTFENILASIVTFFTSSIPLWSLVVILLGAAIIGWLIHKLLNKRSNLEQQRQLEPYHKKQLQIAEMNFKGIIGSGKSFVCSAYYGIDTEWFNVTDKIRSVFDNQNPNVDIGHKLLSDEDGLPTIHRTHRLILTYIYDKQFHAVQGVDGQKLVLKSDKIYVE